MQTSCHCSHCLKIGKVKKLKDIENDDTCRIAGDKFTAADVCMEFPVEFTELLPDISLSDYPKIQAWQKKIKQRDAYKKAMDKNGDYDLKSLLKMF